MFLFNGGVFFLLARDASVRSTPRVVARSYVNPGEVPREPRIRVARSYVCSSFAIQLTILREHVWLLWLLVVSTLRHSVGVPIIHVVALRVAQNVDRIVTKISTH